MGLMDFTTLQITTSFLDLQYRYTWVKDLEIFVYAHVISNTYNVQFSHIASADNNYDISVYSVFWIGSA